MKTILAFLLFTFAAFGQTPVMPSDLVATGLSWNRYAATSFSEITTLAIRIGQTNIYSWSTLDTPIVKTPAGQTPAPSSIRTGAAYVFAQTARVGAFALGDFGLATTPGATVAQYSGGLGLAIRFSATSHWYVMPLYRVISTTGSGVEAVPELMCGFTF